MNHKERGERVRQTVLAHGGRITGLKANVVTFCLPAGANIDAFDLGGMRAKMIGPNHFRVKLEEPRRRHGRKMAPEKPAPSP